MPAKPDFDVNKATLAQLAEEVLVLRADLNRIGAEFLHEARTRQWCDDYDRWTRHINRQLSRPCFIIRESMWSQEVLAQPYRNFFDHDPMHTVPTDEVPIDD